MTTQQALDIAQQRIDQLQQLADPQAALINEKNDEIAQLRRQVRERGFQIAHCQSHDYADDFADDCEAGLIDAGEVTR